MKQVAGLFCFVIAAALIYSALAQTPSARFKDFQAPATDEAGRKSMIKGKDASHIGNGIFQITAPHVDTYKADGTLDMSIDATECLLNNDKTKDVWSDKDLSVKTGDARLTIKGRGFRWEPTKSTLTISNQVEAIIRRQSLVDPKAAPSTNNATITVTSDRLDHHLDSVIFSGHVHVVDAQGEVRCDLLKVRFDANNALQQIEAIDDVLLVQGQTEARGRRALYNPGNGLLRLMEKTTWKMADRSGSSELLVLDRTNNTVRAETNVKMILPANLLSTNLQSQAATVKTNATASTNVLTITSESFDYAATNALTHGPIAIYNGDVHAFDSQGSLDCELLTIYFDRSNHLARAVADRSVHIVRPDGFIDGRRAVFENDEVTVNGEPHWRLENKNGSSEIVSFNPRTREVRARKIRMEIPSSSTNLVALTTLSTNKPALFSTNMLTITALMFTNKNSVATFSGEVRATEPWGQIDANELAVYFNQTNRAERVLARGDVILTEEKGQAIGQQADYTLADGIIHLTGNPRVLSEDDEIIAREFIVNRNTSKTYFLPPWHAQVRRKK